MTHYCDSSALLAWFDPGNPHFRVVERWRDKERGAVVPCYNRLLQVEVSHALRRLDHAYSGVAWHAFRAWEVGRFSEWQKLDLARLTDRADSLSQDYKPALQCGFWDLCHVAAARMANVMLVTCDKVQSEAAEAIGLKTVLLATTKT
jgi:predicted nucleic acid-binding protein